MTKIKTNTKTTMYVTVHGRGRARFECVSQIDGRFRVKVTLCGKSVVGTFPGPQMNAVQRSLLHWEKSFTSKKVA